ncbi:MAG: quaternary ammonium compound resistance protein, partial [Faecalibacterium sp.]|nr:quaternary ammonium compound resistance protein [Faecalibacterium sp.]
TDIRKADLLKNGKIVSGKVNAVKRVHIKFHMSTYHLADEDVIYPWVIRYQYKIGKDTYYGQSHWFWFNPLVSKGTPIKVTIDPQNPERSIVAAWES